MPQITGYDKHLQIIARTSKRRDPRQHWDRACIVIAVSTSQYTMTQPKHVKYHGSFLVREVDHEASECLRCGANRAREIRRRKAGRGSHRKYELVEISRPLYSYDDTQLAFCNRECFAAYWDGILRKNGKDFQRFIRELVSNPAFPPSKLGDKVFLDKLMKYAKKLASQ